MHSKAARFIEHCRDHATPVWRPSKDDELPSQVGVVPLLDTGVEGAQVDIEDESRLVHSVSCLDEYFVSAISFTFPSQSPTNCDSLASTVTDYNSWAVRAKLT